MSDNDLENENKKYIYDIDSNILKQAVDEISTAKIKLLFNKDLGFYTSFLFSINISWDMNIKEMYLERDKTLKINPEWFINIRESAKDRVEVHKSILMKAIFHYALLHMVRCGNRDQNLWKEASNIKVKQMLSELNMSQIHKEDSNNKFFEHKIPSTEGIYEELKKRKSSKDKGDAKLEIGSKNNSFEISFNKKDTNNHIHDLISAKQRLNNNKNRGITTNSEIEEIFQRFIKPQVDWKSIIRQFFTEITNNSYTWARRNRRFLHMHLPSIDTKVTMGSICVFYDTSGSVSNEEIQCFNSEMRYVKETYNPKKLTLINFDTEIHEAGIQVMNKEDDFKVLKIYGRGGTDLKCVYNYIMKHRPEGILLFSDFYCPPMNNFPSNYNPRMINICINNEGIKSVPYGRLVHIKNLIGKDY